MRFAPSEEQVELRDLIRQVVTERSTPEVLRAAVDPSDAKVGGLRAALADVGLWGLLVPESDDGLGLDENYLVSALTEAGWAGVPLPLSATVGAAAGLLAAAGRTTEVMSGEQLVAADPESTGLAASGAAALLLRGGAGGLGSITVVDLTDAQRVPVESVDPSAGLQRLSGGTELAVVDDPALVRQAWLRGVLGTSAELVGLGRRMVEITTAYTKDRQQFGAPIGSFQAIKHHLANALIAVERAAPVVAGAAARVAAGDPEAEQFVCAAKVLASEAAHAVSRLTIQSHGAIAYTTEYDLQLFAKRAWRLEREYGSAAWHRARVADLLGVPGA